MKATEVNCDWVRFWKLIWWKQVIVVWIYYLEKGFSILCAQKIVLLCDVVTPHNLHLISWQSISVVLACASHSQDLDPVLTLGSQQLEVVENFVSIGSWVIAGCWVRDEVNSRIVKTRGAYTNLDYFQCLRNIS